jgi:hypothetical protein
MLERTMLYNILSSCGSGNSADIYLSIQLIISSLSEFLVEESDNFTTI